MSLSKKLRLDWKSDKEQIDEIMKQNQIKLSNANKIRKRTGEIIKCFNIILLDVIIVSFIVLIVEFFIYGNNHLILITSFVGIYFSLEFIIRCLIIKVFVIKENKIFDTIVNIYAKEVD